MRNHATLLAGVMLIAGFATDAAAHAMLRKAVPAVGSTITSAPPELTLEFSEALEPHFTTVAVLDANGAAVDAGDKHLSDGNPKRLIIGLKPLPAGTYKVLWQATSVDTHKSAGSFEFTVRP